MTAGPASVTIPDTYTWLTVACASASVSCTSTTSPTAGNTTCELSRSCRSTLHVTNSIPDHRTLPTTSKSISDRVNDQPRDPALPLYLNPQAEHVLDWST